MVYCKIYTPYTLSIETIEYYILVVYIVDLYEIRIIHYRIDWNKDGSGWVIVSCVDHSVVGHC